MTVEDLLAIAQQIGRHMNEADEGRTYYSLEEELAAVRAELKKRTELLLLVSRTLEGQGELAEFTGLSWTEAEQVFAELERIRAEVKIRGCG